MLRIDGSPLDYTIIALYFVTVIGIGLGARRLVETDLDFFLWVGAALILVSGLFWLWATTRSLVDELEDEEGPEEEVKADEQPGLAQP